MMVDRRMHSSERDHDRDRSRRQPPTQSTGTGTYDDGLASSFGITLGLAPRSSSSHASSSSPKAHSSALPALPTASSSSSSSSSPYSTRLNLGAPPAASSSTSAATTTKAGFGRGTAPSSSSSAKASRSGLSGAAALGSLSGVPEKDVSMGPAPGLSYFDRYPERKNQGPYIPASAASLNQSTPKGKGRQREPEGSKEKEQDRVRERQGDRDRGREREKEAGRAAHSDPRAQERREQRTTRAPATLGDAIKVAAPTHTSQSSRSRPEHQTIAARTRTESDAMPAHMADIPDELDVDEAGRSSISLGFAQPGNAGTSASAPLAAGRERDRVKAAAAASLSPSGYPAAPLSRRASKQNLKPPGASDTRLSLSKPAMYAAQQPLSPMLTTPSRSDCGGTGYDEPVSPRANGHALPPSPAKAPRSPRSPFGLPYRTPSSSHGPHDSSSRDPTSRAAPSAAAMPFPRSPGPPSPSPPKARRGSPAEETVRMGRRSPTPAGGARENGMLTSAFALTYGGSGQSSGQRTPTSQFHSAYSWDTENWTDAGPSSIDRSGKERPPTIDEIIARRTKGSASPVDREIEVAGTYAGSSRAMGKSLGHTPRLVTEPIPSIEDIIRGHAHTLAATPRPAPSSSPSSMRDNRSDWGSSSGHFISSTPSFSGHSQTSAQTRNARTYTNVVPETFARPIRQYGDESSDATSDAESDVSNSSIDSVEREVRETLRAARKKNGASSCGTRTSSRRRVAAFPDAGASNGYSARDPHQAAPSMSRTDSAFSDRPLPELPPLALKGLDGSGLLSPRIDKTPSPSAMSTPTHPPHRRSRAGSGASSTSANASGSNAPDEASAVTRYVRSARLTRLITLRRAPNFGLTVSVADVGLATGHPVFIFLGLGGVRYLIGLYDEMAAALGLRLVCIDRWGLGRTDDIPSERRGVLEWGAVVDEVATVLGISRLSILAHSAGAPYAMATVLTHPERIAGPVHLLAPWVSVSLESGYKWLKYVPDGVIRTAQAAEWKMQGWKLGKLPALPYEAIGYDAKSIRTSATSSPTSPNHQHALPTPPPPLSASPRRSSFGGMDESFSTHSGATLDTVASPIASTAGMPPPTSPRLAAPDTPGLGRSVKSKGSFFGSFFTPKAAPPSGTLHANGSSASLRAGSTRDQDANSLSSGPRSPSINTSNGFNLSTGGGGSDTLLRSASSSSSLGSANAGGLADLGIPASFLKYADGGLGPVTSMSSGLTASASGPINGAGRNDNMGLKRSSSVSNANDQEAHANGTGGASMAVRSASAGSIGTLHSSSRPTSVHSHGSWSRATGAAAAAAAAVAASTGTSTPSTLHLTPSTLHSASLGAPATPTPSSVNSTPSATGTAGSASTGRAMDLGTALLRASHAESLKGGTADLLTILGRAGRPWGFTYADVHHPTKVWHGDRDERIGLGSVLWMEREMSDCQIRIVKGAGHGLMTNVAVVVEALER